MTVDDGISSVVVSIGNSPIVSGNGCFRLGALASAPKHVRRCTSVTTGDRCGWLTSPVANSGFLVSTERVLPRFLELNWVFVAEDLLSVAGHASSLEKLTDVDLPARSCIAPKQVSFVATGSQDLSEDTTDGTSSSDASLLGNRL